MSLVRQPLPALTIRASDLKDPEHLAHLLRVMYGTLGTALSDTLRAVDRDERMSDARVATALKGAGNNLYFLASGHEAAGQIAMMVDTRTFAFSDGTTTVGGVTPTFGAPHNLLDGSQDKDTLAGSVVLGDLIAGNATPKWARVAGQTTATRKFLRQTGTGTVSAVPAWDTLTAADVPTGWQDVANLITEIVTTDKVVIGAATTSGGTRLLVVNAGAISDAVIGVKAVAGQTGDLLRFQTSVAHTLSRFDSAGRLLLGGADAATPAGIFFGDPISTGLIANTNAVISWCGAGGIGPPVSTADLIGCPGGRIYTYKDISGSFDNAYGQDVSDSWVLVSDDSITYSIYTILSTGATPYLRAQWAGNGDLTNYGKILSRKTLKGAGVNGVVNGVPGIELEQTGAGTNAIKVRAPATVSAARTQLLQDVNATVVMVGDKAPAVGTRQMGKVDSITQTNSITSTGLTSGAAAGFYRVSYTLLVTALDATAGSVTFAVAYTDTLGATTQSGAALVETATGRQTGSFLVQLASGDITYTATVAGTPGTARYAIYIRVEALG